MNDRESGLRIMCILCVVQRWSRRVATMLPWLVIPLIVLWALSQLLPPALRFEITSPRLACVLVLLATLFWYEILMPHLSGWRARRAARLRERRRTEALELQKLRKTATRRCRNCHMPYRDQNPGGGRFMCSYCGHISKRPELDLPDQMESHGVIADVVGKNGWLCYADGNGNWAGPDPTKYWNGGGGGDGGCSTERSCFGVIFFTCKLLSCFLSSVRWLRGKFFRFGSSREDGSSDLDRRGLLGKGENDGVNFHESRGEKARRKAEEKRQARLEKEMLEEEERKQREEVARLVEERRRRLRDEMLALETERSKGSAADGDRDGKKEMDRRRRDGRKDRDKASSKSNSDGEEHEKRASREQDRKREFEKKVENELRDLQKGAAADNYKSQAALDGVYGNKAAVNNSRYFDRMKGSFLYSSSGFAGPFFGRNIHKSAAVAKIVKPAAGIIDHGPNSVNRRDTHPVVHVAGKLPSSAGDKASKTNLSRLGTSDVQPKTTVIKKSWQQLFTGSSAVSPYPDANSTGQMNQNAQLTDRGDHPFNNNLLGSYSTTTDNLVDYGKSLPFTVFPQTSNPIFPIVPDTTIPPLEEPPRSSVSEEAELFEDPCYDPDPISLLGPVSESLDRFPLDLDTGFTTRNKTEGSSYLKNVLASADVNKPSPIEPPLSKVHFPEGKRSASDQLFCSPNSDISSNIQEQSTWQMWGSPLAQEGLGLIGRPSSWFSPLVHTNSQQQDFLSHKPMVPPISKSNDKLIGISTQHAHTGNHEQNRGTYSPLGPGFSDNSIWQQNFFQSPSRVAGDDHLLPRDLMVNISQSEATYTSPIESTAGHPFETHPTNNWPKDDFVLDDPQEAGNLNPGRANIGSLFSRGPDVPSVWSFTK